MIVTLDGQRLDAPHAAPATLQTLIDQVRAAHEDCLIISVALDGTTLDDEHLHAALEQPLAPDVQVDLESGDAPQLVREALRGLAMEYAKTATVLTTIADRLGAGESTTAIHQMGNFIAVWSTCHRVLIQCSGLIGEDLTQRLHQGRTVAAWFEEVVARLVDVRNALEARDMVLLTDLVRYELPPVCSAWQTLLEDIAEQLVPAQV